MEWDEGAKLLWGTENNEAKDQTKGIPENPELVMPKRGSNQQQQMSLGG